VTSGHIRFLRKGLQSLGEQRPQLDNDLVNRFLHRLGHTAPSQSAQLARVVAGRAKTHPLLGDPGFEPGASRSRTVERSAQNDRSRSSPFASNSPRRWH